MAQLLSGREVSAAMNEELKKRTGVLMQKGITPTLAVIRVGENPGDLAYERGAKKRCDQTGIRLKSYVLPSDAAQEELLKLIDELNADTGVHCVLLLRPLPSGLDQDRICNALLPGKDADCMTDASICGVYTGKNTGFAPCTAEACMRILDHYGIDVCGRRAVVIGRSLVIGKPAAMMLLKRNATVTICHTRTRDLEKITREADIIVAAAGSAGMIKAGHLGKGQIVLDVGINTDENGKLCGDVDFAAADAAAAAVTPVPGGVGAVTTAVLAAHVIEAAEKMAE